MSSKLCLLHIRKCWVSPRQPPHNKIPKCLSFRYFVICDSGGNRRARDSEAKLSEKHATIWSMLSVAPRLFVGAKRIPVDHPSNRSPLGRFFVSIYLSMSSRLSLSNTNFVNLIRLISRQLSMNQEYIKFLPSSNIMKKFSLLTIQYQ